MPVVYDTRVSASLVGHLVGAINGASIARKTSFLKDRMGEQLFSKDIRIIDDPLRVRGLRSQTFDAEGVQCRKARADRRGRVDHVAAGLRHRARAAGHDRHAHRGVSSSPSPGSYNLHLEPAR